LLWTRRWDSTREIHTRHPRVSAALVAYERMEFDLILVSAKIAFLHQR
jgi:hypothetical protein